jgi:hypothetical protein
MTYTILETQETINTHSTSEYDENGSPIPGTEVTWQTKTVTTKVEYDFSGYGKHVVEIAHFNPQSDSDVKLGILNRAVTEKRNLGIEN